MKADLTRNSFDPFKHFSRVLMQQGRVQLDADWNEQASVLLHFLQALAGDVIGPQGGPAGNLGFGISPYPSDFSVQQDFQIAAFALKSSGSKGNERQRGLGIYYVDGIRCEVDLTAVAITVKAVNKKEKKATVLVNQRTLDGLALQTGQYFELFDDSILPNPQQNHSPIMVKITGVSTIDAQKPELTLTLQGVPAQLGEASAPKLQRVITYLTQPDYPVPDSEKLAPNGTATYLIYLDVWERHISYLDDDSIREVALGGPDTAARAKIVWQVKAVQGGFKGNSNSPCDDFHPSDLNFLVNLSGTKRGRLKAKAKEKSASADPCIMPPTARYRGPENQLYRVEILRSGLAWDGKNGKDTAATFKWSRENGSVAYSIVSITASSATTMVTVENLGRDERFGLKVGEWVEIQDDDSVLQNRATALLQVQSVDRAGQSVSLNGAADAGVVENFTKYSLARHPLLRRWDQQAGDPAEGGLTLGSDNGALVQESVWLELENGVLIQFQPPVAPTANANANNIAKQYHTGDYWLIPARTATGDVEWPTEADEKGNPVPLAKPPDGIAHHYAPLAVIGVENGKVTFIADCRKSFNSLAGSP